MISPISLTLTRTATEGILLKVLAEQIEWKLWVKMFRETAFFTMFVEMDANISEIIYLRHWVLH